MRYRLFLLTALATAAIATPAAAQGITAAGIITGLEATLGQLVTVTQVGMGGAGIVGLFQLVKMLIAGRGAINAWKASIEAGTVNAGDDKQQSLIERFTNEGVDAVLGDKAASKGGGASLLFKTREITDAARHAQDRLREYGVTIDTEVLRNKARARLGQLLASKLGLPAPIAAAAAATPASPPA